MTTTIGQVLREAFYVTDVIGPCPRGLIVVGSSGLLDIYVDMEDNA